MIIIERRVIRVGNSLGIRIPAAFLEELGVKQDDVIEMEFDKNINAIIIKNKSTTPNDNYLELTVKGIVDQYLKDKGL